jgi:hypothetical protein
MRARPQNDSGGLVVASPVIEGLRDRKFIALQDVTIGFNFIGRHASDLRKLMTASEVERFDAVVEDVMSALLALPAIGMKNPNNPTTLKPRAARPERIPQIVPDLKALDKFFQYLEDQQTGNGRKLLESARKNIGRMLSAVPVLLPTVAVPAK